MTQTLQRCYQTQYADPQTGDVLAQARWYAPSSGTFRSRDTYAGNLNTPVSLNRYTYAHNNPIRYSDPSGRCVEIWVPACANNPLTMANAIEVNGRPMEAANITFPETVAPSSIGAHPDVVIYLTGAEDLGASAVVPSSEDEAVYLVQFQSGAVDGPASWQTVSARALGAGDTGAPLHEWSAQVLATEQWQRDQETLRQGRSPSNGLEPWVSPMISFAAILQGATGSDSLRRTVTGLKSDQQFLNFIADTTMAPGLADERALYYFEARTALQAEYADELARVASDADVLAKSLTTLRWLGTAASVYDFGASVYGERNNGAEDMARAGAASLGGAAGAWGGFKLGAVGCGWIGPVSAGVCGLVGGTAGAFGGKRAVESLWDNPDRVRLWNPLAPVLFGG